MTLFKCFKHKALRKFSREKLHWVEPAKVYPSESQMESGILMKNLKS